MKNPFALSLRSDNLSRLISNTDQAMAIRFDPVLFTIGYWHSSDPQSPQRFQSFACGYISTLRHLPDQAQQAELDSFIALLEYPHLLKLAFPSIEELFADQYVFRSNSHLDTLD